MNIAGKIIKKTGYGLAFLIEESIKQTGIVISKQAAKKGNKKLSLKSVETSKIIGETIGDGTRIVSHVTGELLSIVSNKSYNGIKKIAKNAVKKEVKYFGDSQAFFDEENLIYTEFEIVDKKSL